MALALPSVALALPSLAFALGCPLDFSTFALSFRLCSTACDRLLDFTAHFFFEVMSVSKNQDLMYVETGDEDGWRVTALSSDAEGGYRPPVAFKKKKASPEDEQSKDPPTDDVTSGIERLALEESTHVISKDVSSGSVEPLPSSDSSPGVSAEKPLPPSSVDDSSAMDSFVDAPSAKETRKEEELVPSHEPEPKKEEAAMAVEEEQEKEKEQDEDVIFESLPDKPSEVMEPDFSPDKDEEMAQKPLPELEDSSDKKDISLGAKPKSAPTSRPTLEEFSRSKSLLIADGADSDSNAPRAFPPPLLEVAPVRSSLRASSRPKSRPPSRSRGLSRSRQEDRSRSRASPERREMDGKSKVITVSGHSPPVSGPLPLTAPKSSLPPLKWMPEDICQPCFKEDFLRWTSCSLQRDWNSDSRCWPNFHIGLYLYEGTAEWPLPHPRCLAAGALSQDESLAEPWICWACFKPAGPGAHAKTSWRTQWDFITHWYKVHAKPLHKRWTYHARDIGLSRHELATACLGVNLEDSPLPAYSEGLKCVPKGLPKLDRGHNPLVYGPPWFCGIRGRFDAGRRPLPPPGPPPSSSACAVDAQPSGFCHAHGLPSLNASSSDGPIRPLPKAASASAPEVLDLTHDLAPAMVGPEGSRLSDINSGKGLSLMGWHVPLDVKQWWPLFQDELDIFCRPFRGIKAYSDSRPPWFTRFNLKQDLKNWFLGMEEHSFYLFLYNVLCTKCLTHPGCLPIHDREAIFARLQIYSSDLRDEIQHFKSFQDLSDLDHIVAENVLCHVRSILALRVPLASDFTFIRAPDWTKIPTSLDEHKVHYRR